MSLDDLIAKLQIKLFNFEKKYGMKPHTIILNPIFNSEQAHILCRVCNKSPFITQLDIKYSNRVKQDDFEVY